MGYRKDNIIAILTVAMVANLTVLAWFEWGSYSSYRDFQVTQERHMKAEELRGIIVHLDEVLTMSARMAAATGDLKWEERYRESEPKLDAAIKEAMALWPEAYHGEAAARTDTANLRLVEMENRAFDLVRQGHVKEARAILHSDEYEDHKRIYAQGMVSFARSPDLHIQLSELRGIIVHLEEVLTMSVRMAAVTGDLRWEKRYREFEPKLDAAIKEAMALCPEACHSEPAARTDTANIKLAAMANQAFDLIRQGNSDSAVSVLSGNAYEQQKRVYSDGMNDFKGDITKVAIADMERSGRATSVKTATAFLLSPFLVLIWFIVFQAVRRWGKTLIHNNRLLAEQTDELTELNENLDRKVAERTRELEASRQAAVKARQAAEDANKSLTAEVTERQRTEEELQASELQMADRVKQLNCLYGLSRIIETHGISLEEILQQTLRLIPPGWQYPDITCARLLLEGQEYMSDNYRETEWKLSQNLIVAGHVAGSLDVCYLEERAEADEGPFVKEERNLIRAIAEHLQRAIEHKRAEDLQHTLFRISESVNQTSNLEGVLEIIRETLSPLINTTNFYVALYDAENDLYSFPYCVDQYEDTDFTPQQLNNSLTDYVRRTEKPIIVNEQTHNMLIDAGEVQLVGRPSPIWLGVPLKTADRIIGVVVVQSYSDPETYSEADLDIMSFASENITLAIERKRAEEERKRLQKSLFQSDKMASIGQLAAGVAHEINNPVGYISSNLNTMNKYVRKITEMTSHCDLFPRDQKEQFEEVLTDFGDAIAESMEGAERVKKIVSDLKGFSRTDTVEMKPTDIAVCIDTTLSIVWNQLKYHCEIKKDLGETPPVVCHPNQINQVIMNLLINAGQATDGKSGVIEIKTWTEADQVVISIKDNGCGIPKENLGRLYEPFFTTKDIGKGTGLGLSLSYGIVLEHHGKIEVTSEVGVGTEFRVILPVGKAEEQMEPAATC